MAALRDEFLDAFSRVRQEHQGYVAERPRSRTPVPGALPPTDVARLVDRHFGPDIAVGDYSRLDQWIGRYAPPGAATATERARLIALRDRYLQNPKGG